MLTPYSLLPLKANSCGFQKLSCPRGDRSPYKIFSIQSGTASFRGLRYNKSILLEQALIVFFIHILSIINHPLKRNFRQNAS